MRISLKNWWLKIQNLWPNHWWPNAWRQQVTRAGLAYSVALLLVAMAAFLSANNLLFLIFAAMLSTMLISSFVSRLGLSGLELDLLLPEHISARRKVRAGVRLRNMKGWVPSFSIHLAGAAESGFNSILYFPVLPGGSTTEEPVDLYFQRRGSQKERSFMFSTRFPFGFAERRELVTTRHEIIVYPCLDPQPGFNELLVSISGDIEAQHRGRGTDFYRIRPYEAMESARHVDWKATAHTGDLQVREFAREQEQRVDIYLDLRAPREKHPWFEKAVEGAAFLAHRLAATGVELNFKTQNFSAALPETHDIYTILKYLALVAPDIGARGLTPDETEDFQVIFTADPARLESLGWDSGPGRRILGPDDLPVNH